MESRPRPAKPFYLQRLFPDPREVLMKSGPEPEDPSEADPVDFDALIESDTFGSDGPELDSPKSVPAEATNKAGAPQPSVSESAKTPIERIASRYMRRQNIETSLSPTPNDGARESQPRPPFRPFYSRATLEHLKEVFEDWKEPRLKNCDAEVTDFLGRTFLIPCQVYEISTDLDDIAPDRDSPRHPGTFKYAKQGLCPADKVFRDTPFTTYQTLEELANPRHPQLGSNSPLAAMPMMVSYSPLILNTTTGEPFSGVPTFTAEHITNRETRRRLCRCLRRACGIVKRSSVFADMKQALKDVDLTCISQIILFGAGTMTVRSWDKDEHPQRTSEQTHALLLLLRALLSEDPNTAIRALLSEKNHELAGGTYSGWNPQIPPQSLFCVAQDPIYQPRDIDVLHHHSISILDDPCGLLKVDSSSIVIAVGCRGIREVIANIDIENPPVVIQPYDKIARKHEQRRGQISESPARDDGRLRFDYNQHHRRLLWRQLYNITAVKGNLNDLKDKDDGLEVLVLKSHSRSPEAAEVGASEESCDQT